MKTIYDELYAIGKKHTKHEIWVFSDLQQKQFELAEKCLNICMTDYENMGKPAVYRVKQRQDQSDGTCGADDHPR